MNSTHNFQPPVNPHGAHDGWCTDCGLHAKLMLVARNFIITYEVPDPSRTGKGSNQTMYVDKQQRCTRGRTTMLRR